CLALVASAAFFVPAAAQDKKEGDKKDPAKTDKAEKDNKGKDGPKKDDTSKKDTSKKLPEADKKFTGKIIGIRDRVIEIADPDAKKMAEVKAWERQQFLEMLKMNFQDRQKRADWVQKELQKKESDAYASKGKEYRAHERMKVRAKTLPIEYDDKGF